MQYKPNERIKIVLVLEYNRGLCVGDIKCFSNANKLAQFAGITPRHPVFRVYYEKRKAEGKSSQQALICILRRQKSSCEIKEKELQL